MSPDLRPNGRARSCWAMLFAAGSVAGCHCTSTNNGNNSAGVNTFDVGDTAASSVLEHHLRPSRDGLYVEPAFTRSAAASLHLDPNFNGPIQGATYAQPLYVEGSAGGHDRLIVATE